jgi:hypothetical protein
MNATTAEKSFSDFKAEYAVKTAKANEWAKAKGYGLSGIKIFLAGSEETICFRANVTQKGKVVGTAENQGCGGPTFVDLRGADSTFAEYLEMFVAGLIGKEVEKKETAKTISKIKSAAKRKGHAVYAYKMDRNQITSVSHPNPDPMILKAWLDKDGGSEGWTIEKI